MIRVDFTLSTHAILGATAICMIAGAVLFLGALARRSKGFVLTLALVFMCAGLAGEAITLGLLIAGRL